MKLIIIREFTQIRCVNHLCQKEFGALPEVVEVDLDSPDSHSIHPLGTVANRRSSIRSHASSYFLVD